MILMDREYLVQMYILLISLFSYLDDSDGKESHGPIM